MGNIKGRSLILMVILSFIWGSSFILMKKGMLTFSPAQVAALRIVIAALFFLPFVLFRKRAIPKEKYGIIALFGLLEVGIPPFLYTFAQTKVDSSVAGILNSLVPIFTIIAGTVLFGVKTTLSKVAGVVVGFLGAVLLMFANADGGNVFEFSTTSLYGLLIVLSTLLYGIATNILKEKLSDINSTDSIATAFMFVGAPAAIFLCFTDFSSIDYSTDIAFQSIIAVILVAVFGYGLSLIIFNKLVQESSALFASFVTYLIPFVAIMWGVLDGESVSFLAFISLFIIIGGIVLATGKIKKKKVVELADVE